VYVCRSYHLKVTGLKCNIVSILNSKSLIKLKYNMNLIDCIAIVSILCSPLVAIFVSIWYQNRKEKRQAKMDIFKNLIAYRKQYPIPMAFVAALNQIDIMFHKDKKVIAAWKSYLESLNPESSSFQSHDNRLLDLLDEMAKSLGYKNLKQTTYADFYSPQQFSNQVVSQQELYNEVMRVLKNSTNFGIQIPNPSHQQENTQNQAYIEGK